MISPLPTAWSSTNSVRVPLAPGIAGSGLGPAAANSAVEQVAARRDDVPVGFHELEGRVPTQLNAYRSRPSLRYMLCPTGDPAVGVDDSLGGVGVELLTLAAMT